MRTYLLLTLILFSCITHAQEFYNPLQIPDTLSGSQIVLNVQSGMTQFMPGVMTPTLGYNQSYLGPTIFLEKGEVTNVDIQNNLTEATTLHWHGMEIEAEYDGGPHSKINPGSLSQPVLNVRDAASTMWYHSHLHSQSLRQVNEGLAGMLIVRDDVEKALSLPRSYGVDDIPLIVQDKSFDTSGIIDNEAVLGDTFLINATLSPYVELPAQMVRLRLLNASIQRIYNFGFDDDRAFQLIATDGGLRETPLAMNRIWLSPGERVEIILDLNSQMGDSLYLTNYASEIPYGFTGGIPGLDVYPSPLNGADKNVLKIKVKSQISPVVDSIPTSFVPHDKPDSNDVSRERFKVLNGKAQQGVIKWTINEKSFDMSYMDDTIFTGSTEIWEVRNSTHIAHPFHIHSGHFYLLEYDSMPTPAHLQGKKDVVLVKPNTNAIFIMKFPDFHDSEVPYMYHCHMLDHEDDGMMAQFIVVDSSFLASSSYEAENFNSRIFPNPVSEFLILDIDEKYTPPFQLEVFDIKGSSFWSGNTSVYEEQIQLNFLPGGKYILRIRDEENRIGSLPFIKLSE